MTRELVRLESRRIITAAHDAAIIHATKDISIRAGVVKDNSVCTTMDAYEKHFIGQLGQQAISQFTGAPCDGKLYLYGDRGIDMIFAGQAVQIKTSKRSYQNHHAYLDSLDEFKADWLIECSLHTVACVCVHGFISKYKFARVCFNGNLGYGKRKLVKESDLTDIDKFVAMLNSHGIDGEGLSLASAKANGDLFV